VARRRKNLEFVLLILTMESIAPEWLVLYVEEKSKVVSQ
jgi:hypothetical protein